MRSPHSPGSSRREASLGRPTAWAFRFPRCRGTSPNSRRTSMSGFSTGRRDGSRSPRADRRFSIAACSFSPIWRRPRRRSLPRRSCRRGRYGSRRRRPSPPATSHRRSLHSRARYPQMRFDVELSERIVDLVEEGFDLAVRIGVPGSQNIVARRVGATRVPCCAAPSYLERHGEPREPEDLAKHLCLTYEYLPNRNVWSFRDPKGGERSVRDRRSGPLEQRSLPRGARGARHGHFPRARFHLRAGHTRRQVEGYPAGIRAAAFADLRRLSEPPASVGEGARVCGFSRRALRKRKVVA